MVLPTESFGFVAGELGKCGRNLEEIGAKFLGPNRFGVFFKTWRNAYLHVHDLGHIGKLEANLDSFKTAHRRDNYRAWRLLLHPYGKAAVLMFGRYNKPVLTGNGGRLI